MKTDISQAHFFAIVIRFSYYCHFIALENNITNMTTTHEHSPEGKFQKESTLNGDLSGKSEFPPSFDLKASGGFSAGSPVQRKLNDEDYDFFASEVFEGIQEQDLTRVTQNLQKLKRRKKRVKNFLEAYERIEGANFTEDLEGAFEEESRQLIQELVRQQEGDEEELIGNAPRTKRAKIDSAETIRDALQENPVNKATVLAELASLKQNAFRSKRLMKFYNEELEGGITGNGLKADLEDRLNHEDYHYSLFLMYGEKEKNMGGSFQPQTAGVEEGAMELPGGDMEVNSGVDFTEELQDGFSVEYDGAASEYTFILQFVNRTIIAVQDDGSQVYVSADIETSGGTYELTPPEGAGLDNLNVDTSSKKKPWYESSGLNYRDDELTKIFDDPSGAKGYAEVAFDGIENVDHVNSYVDFHTYLVRDHQPLREAHIRVSYLYNSREDDPEGQASLVSLNAVEALNPLHKQVLVEQFPKYDYIK